MSPAEIAAVNRRLLSLEGPHLQMFLEAVRADAAGSAGPLPLSIAPGYTSDRRIKWPMIDWISGRWHDVGGAGKGNDLPDLILWQAGLDQHIDREIDEELEVERERRRALRIAEARGQAASALARWIDALPPAASPLRPQVGVREAERPEPASRDAAHRSLHRG